MYIEVRICHGSTMAHLDSAVRDEPARVRTGRGLNVLGESRDEDADREERPGEEHERAVGLRVGVGKERVRVSCSHGEGCCGSGAHLVEGSHALRG